MKFTAVVSALLVASAAAFAPSSVEVRWTYALFMVESFALPRMLWHRCRHRANASVTGTFLLDS